MNTKNNQRFKETEQTIQKVLLELARTTDIRRVTVRAICEKAGINRSTFYSHYQDINDLVDKIGREMMQDISHLFQSSGNPIHFFISQPLLAEMLAYVKEHQDFFDIYLNHYSSVASETFSLLWERWAKPFVSDFGLSDESEMQYHFTFFKAGFLAVLSQWIRNDCPESPEKLAQIILKRISSLSSCPAPNNSL